MGFFSLGRFQCAWIHLYLCVCILCFFSCRFIVTRWGDLVRLKPNPVLHQCFGTTIDDPIQYLNYTVRCYYETNVVVFTVTVVSTSTSYPVVSLILYFQRLHLFAWCVRLNQLLVGFRTHLIFRTLYRTYLFSILTLPIHVTLIAKRIRRLTSFSRSRSSHTYIHTIKIC